MTCGVYVLESLSGKFYIGSSVDIKVRLKRHRTDLRRGVHSNQRLQDAFAKYGQLIERILLICRPEDRLMYEQTCIDALRPEYNLSPQATAGFWTEEMKERQRQTLKGRKRSPEAVAKTAAALRGKPKSQEHKARLAAANLGKKASAETRMKMAAKKKTPAMLDALARGRQVNPHRVSDEQREKLREASLRHYRKNPPPRDERGRLLPR